MFLLHVSMQFGEGFEADMVLIHWFRDDETEVIEVQRN